MLEKTSYQINSIGKEKYNKAIKEYDTDESLYDELSKLQDKIKELTDDNISLNEDNEKYEKRISEINDILENVKPLKSKHEERAELEKGINVFIDTIYYYFFYLSIVLIQKFSRRKNF